MEPNINKIVLGGRGETLPAKISNPSRRHALTGKRPKHFGLSSGSQGGRSLDASKIEAAYVGYHKLLHDRIATAQDNLRRLATIIETDQLVDTQIWLTKNPKMRVWEGAKVRHKLRGEAHSIRTKPHEATIEIPKNDILNDRFGLYRDRINSLGDAYEDALTELVIGLLVAGTQGTAIAATYDGQNLIDNDHTALSIGGTSQTNIVGGVLDATKFRLGITQFGKVKDENGRPQNLSNRRMTMVVGRDNEVVAETILKQSFLTGGMSNLNIGKADLVVTDWLNAGTISVLGTNVTVLGTEWFLLPPGSSSLLVHLKRGPELLSLEEGDHAFDTGQYQYSVEAEFGGGYGLWQEIQGGTGA